MKLHIALLFILTITALSCGAPIRVFSDVDKDANISAYKSFSWLSEQEIERKGTNPIYYNELNDKRIKHAVYEQMKARGFTYSKNPQSLEMHYHIIVEDKTITLNEPAGYSYGPSWRLKEKTIYPYKEGTLIIDLLDTKTKTLVWRGWATGVVEDVIKKDPEKAIATTIAKIFSLFPYKQ